MKYILYSSIALTSCVSMCLLIIQTFDANITIFNKFQIKLTDIITPVLIINNVIFLISVISFDILYLPLF